MQVETLFCICRFDYHQLYPDGDVSEAFAMQNGPGSPSWCLGQRFGIQDFDYDVAFRELLDQNIARFNILNYEPIQNITGDTYVNNGLMLLFHRCIDYFR